MTVHNCVQGSEEWLQLRLGIPTASEFDRIVTPKKLEAVKSETRDHYLAEKLAEWMIGVPLDEFEDRPPIRGWRERGKLLEAEAVRYYEMERDCQTQAVGLITTDDGMIGCSPDRLIGDDGILELKCPSLEVHVGYMLDPGSLLAEYRLQVQGQMFVSGRPRGDIMSYYPGFPAVIVPLTPEDKVIAALALHVPAFVVTMMECRVKLCQMYGELRRERLGEVKAAENLADRRAAFEDFMGSPASRAVV